MIEWEFRSRRVGSLVLATLSALAIPGFAQGPGAPAHDLFVTRLEGSGDGTGTRSQTTTKPPGEVSSLPVTQLDVAPRSADLDGPRRISLSVSRPLPILEMLRLLVSGTPLSIVTDEAVEGTFIGDLTDLTMRQALEAVLFPRGLDYDVQGTLIRVFPRRATTRLFDVNHLSLRRTWRRGVQSTVAPTPGQVPASDLSTTIDSDLFEELGRGVQSLLSASGRMHVDRTAGLVQVTDFSDRLDQVGVYVEAVQLRATRQVRIEARIFEVTFADAARTSIDWRAVIAQSGGSGRAAGVRGAVGMKMEDFEGLKKALGEQGTVRMIAAPQVVAMNNEPAVMRAGTQGVYFTTASHAEREGRVERTSTPVALFEGLTLSVTAQIAADGIVQLSIAPTYAEKTGQSKSRHGDTFPVLHVSEADTLVRVQDGDTIVISGFLQDRALAKPNTGFASWFGAVSSRQPVKSELVILLTPFVVTPAPLAAGGGPV